VQLDGSMWAGVGDVGLRVSYTDDAGRIAVYDSKGGRNGAKGVAVWACWQSDVVALVRC